MLRPLVAILITLALIKVSLDLIAGSNLSVELWLGRMFWLPNTSVNGIPDILTSMVQLFPVLPLLPLLLLLAVGLLALLEMD